MEEKIDELISLAYKNRFSIYYKPNNCLVRTYFKDGSQHNENDETIIGAVSKMISFLEKENKL